MEKEKPLAVTVDDDPDFNAILGLTLKKLGFEVETTATPDFFLNQVESTHPDICFIDLNITGLGDGFKLISKVRKILGNFVPILVISRISDQQSVAHAIELGANDFVIKPCDQQFLASKLIRYAPHSEEMMVEQIRGFTVPKDASDLKMSLDISIQSVDELGLTINSPHLVAKGTPIWAMGELITEISGHPDKLYLTALSSAANPDGTYQVYLEFDLANEGLLRSVRKWLVGKLGVNPAEN